MSEFDTPFGPEKIRPAAGDGHPMDTEANEFAACILMPEEAYRAEHEAADGSAPRIAERFGVPEAAVILRARMLELDVSSMS